MSYKELNLQWTLIVTLFFIGSSCFFIALFQTVHTKTAPSSLELGVNLRTDVEGDERSPPGDV